MTQVQLLTCAAQVWAQMASRRSWTCSHACDLTDANHDPGSAVDLCCAGVGADGIPMVMDLRARATAAGQWQAAVTKLLVGTC
eukprot:1158424-Pelagomonas_calceolata.AAC.2